jgi:hypothetical protein
MSLPQHLQSTETDEANAKNHTPRSLPDRDPSGLPIADHFAVAQIELVEPQDMYALESS